MTEPTWPLAPNPWEPATNRPAITIRDVKVILTQPEGIRLIVVKIETSEPDLYGYGCATFTQRPRAVVEAIESYLKPMIIGRDPNDIEDIYQTGYLSSYWRTGPIMNNALSGVDQALWDIKGKLANMPVYQLLGGRTRRAATVYTHASGDSIDAVEEAVRQKMEAGFTHVRAQVAVPGYHTYGTAADPKAKMQQPWHESAYTRIVPKLFDHLRSTVGDEVELLHDIHERIHPILAINLAKQLEPYRLFFLEDPFAPEDIGWFTRMREATSIPIAMGELFVNQTEWEYVIRERLIDFIRVHISAIGGLSIAHKLAHFCEFFNVRTAWHGPGDVSPVGHAANLHLDLASSNFGIQEAHIFNDTVREVFPGTPEVRNGQMWSNDKPGLGVEVDEALAAKFPFGEYELMHQNFPPVRRVDGSPIRW